MYTREVEPHFLGACQLLLEALKLNAHLRYLRLRVCQRLCACPVRLLLLCSCSLSHHSDLCSDCLYSSGSLGFKALQLLLALQKLLLVPGALLLQRAAVLHLQRGVLCGQLLHACAVTLRQIPLGLQLQQQLAVWLCCWGECGL